MRHGVHHSQASVNSFAIPGRKEEEETNAECGHLPTETGLWLVLGGADGTKPTLEAMNARRDTKPCSFGRSCD